MLHTEQLKFLYILKKQINQLKYSDYEFKINNKNINIVQRIV